MKQGFQFFLVKEEIPSLFYFLLGCTALHGEILLVAKLRRLNVMHADITFSWSTRTRLLYATWHIFILTVTAAGAQSLSLLLGMMIMIMMSFFAPLFPIKCKKKRLRTR